MAPQVTKPIEKWPARAMNVPNAHYLVTLLRFSLSNNPLLAVSIVLSIGSTVLELAAISCLVPLTLYSTGQPLDPNSIPMRLLTAVGLPADGYGFIQLFAIIFLLRLLTQFTAQMMAVYVSRRLLLQIVTRSFSAVVADVPFKTLDEKSMGYFVSLAGDEGVRASNIIMTVIQIVSTMALALVYFYAISALSLVSGALVLAFLAITFIALFQSFKISQRLGSRAVEQSQATNTLFVDAINGLRTVRAFSAEQFIAKQYKQALYDYVKTLALIDVVSLASRFAPGVFLIGLLLVAAFARYSPGSATLDMAAMSVIVILLLRFFPVAGQVLGLGLRLVSDLRAAKDITELVSSVPRTDLSTAKKALDRPIEAIELLNIAFSHRPDRPVLRNLDLTLRAGRSYALIGISGAGKSTILDLLLGFREPDGGSILINGIRSQDIGIGELRKRVLLATQDATIFSDTVANNLTIGIEASRSDFEHAAQIACLSQHIDEMPQGYDTVLHYRGSNLSGGQRQRLGIARAVLRKPEVLLLDESTSALDSETRAMVVTNLKKEFADRILVFVTHDSYVMSVVDEVLDMSALDPSPHTEPADAVQ